MDGVTHFRTTDATVTFYSKCFIFASNLSVTFYVLQALAHWSMANLNKTVTGTRINPPSYLCSHFTLHPDKLSQS